MNFNIPIPDDFHNVINDLPRHPTRRWQRRTSSAIRDVKFIMIHQQDGTDSLSSVARYHVTPSPNNHISKQGCPGLCYHFAIDLEGNIYLCNDLEDVVWSGGQVKVSDGRRRPYPFSDLIRPGFNVNTNTISLMLQGKFAGPGVKGLTEPTDEQISALSRFLYWATNPLPNGLGFDCKEIVGHCHAKADRLACPGFEYTDFIEETVWTGVLRQLVEKDPHVVTPPMPDIKATPSVAEMQAATERVRAELARRFPEAGPLLNGPITPEEIQAYMRIQSILKHAIALGVSSVSTD